MKNLLSIQDLSSSSIMKKKRHRFPVRIIECAIRLYLQNPQLSYRDVSVILKKLGVHVTHKTVYEWVNKFSQEISNKPFKWNYRMLWDLEEKKTQCNGEDKILYTALSRRKNVLLVLLADKPEPRTKAIFDALLKDLYPAERQAGSLLS